MSGVRYVPPQARQSPRQSRRCERPPAPEPNVFGVFAAIRCINLARRPERLAAFAATAAKAWGDAAWERFDAVDGAASRVLSGPCDFEPLWDARINAGHDARAAAGAHYATTGERGCALSHAALWREAARGGGAQGTWALFLEDDAALCPHFERHFATLWPRVPLGADLVYLGFSDRGPRKYVEGSRSAVFVPAYGFQTHAYALTKRAAAVLVSHLPVVGPVDVWLADNEWFGLRVYCVVVPGAGWRGEGMWLADQDRRFHGGASDIECSSRGSLLTGATTLAGAPTSDGGVPEPAGVDDGNAPTESRPIRFPPTTRARAGDAAEDAADGLSGLRVTDDDAKN
ncbi:hypothetical protein M885DRAFT_549756 [Pelagophyceae sp. CCMP2097]|nr:hypothetical protein M885DRAFT_549756 [Pelagophyceae sp. CCMP2097]